MQRAVHSPRVMRIRVADDSRGGIDRRLSVGEQEQRIRLVTSRSRVTEGVDVRDTAQTDVQFQTTAAAYEVGPAECTGLISEPGNPDDAGGTAADGDFREAARE